MFPRRVNAHISRLPRGPLTCHHSRRAYCTTTAPLLYVYQPPGSHEMPLPWYRPAQQQQPRSTVAPTAMPPPQKIEVAAVAVVRPSEGAAEAPPATPRSPSLATASTSSPPPHPPPLQQQAVATAGQTPGIRPVAPRQQQTFRLSALSGPSLEARIDSIIKVEETVASEPLQRVVQRLIDPEATGIEAISFADFAAMQTKRQLVALGGKKAWLDWLLASPYYQQVARLALDSPAQDLWALQRAGLFTLSQWVEQPNLVQVSARTRSALDAAVEFSISSYMTEVALVVNTGNQLEPVLNRWVSDVVGKFILDSLQISVEAASAAVWKRRSALSSASSKSQGSRADPTSDAALMFNWLADGSDGVSGPAGTAAVAGGNPPPRPGEACTLEHYHSFTRKVLQSVRAQVRHQDIADTRGDEQYEMELHERAKKLIGSAFNQLLRHAADTQLPPELVSLRDSGYLALDRVPGLLKRVEDTLLLRDIPVRYFIFHSTEGTCTTDDAAATAAAAPSLLGVPSSSYPPGAFLTGSEKLDVTLGQWSGQPIPPSADAVVVTPDHPAQQEYLSVLRGIRRHLDRLSVTSIHDIVQHAERYGGNGFSAAESIGLGQLFGSAKLLEDRLASVLSYPLATADNPIHVIEAGYTSGKTALLERLARRARPDEKAVLVRYSGSTAPFAPDLDDHPLAFASRFWFRVALASCPYLIRTEELYSRAPVSVMWWANSKNWSWECYQRLIASASHITWQRGSGVGAAATTNSAAAMGSTTPAQLSCILVDDLDRVMDAMEAKWGSVTEMAAVSAVSLAGGGDNSRSSTSGGDGVIGRGNTTSREALEEEGDEDKDGDEEEDAEATAADRAAHRAERTKARKEELAAAELAERQRQQRLAHWVAAAGKPVNEVLSDGFSRITTALGQVDLVITTKRLSPLFLAHAGAPCRRYFIPVANGVGLQQRLRVLPLMSVLHALHLRAWLEAPGLLYEVVKNSPALAGKTLEGFWTGRVPFMDLRSASVPAPAAGTGTTRRVLLQLGATPITTAATASDAPPPRVVALQHYAPLELFAELPMRHHLLHTPRRSRLRLVELLQRQLSSFSGYLSTDIDTTPQDVKDGLVTPHNHTCSQVHPFALFVIFSHQEALELSSGGVAALSAGRSRERKIVRAWAEVWAEYHYVVSAMATTPERKRDAMRVLLHGALLLRSAAVAGAQLDLNLKVPPYGFPLLASEVRAKGKHAAPMEVRPATTETVRKAVAAYKSFFSNATQSHFPFRPMVGLNGGCDVVFVSGSTLALYDIVTTTQELREVPFRLAETLLGVLHILEKQVLPVDKIKHVQYAAVVSIDYRSSPGRGANGGNSTNSSSGYMNSSAGATVPYLIDMSTVFEDSVMDRLKAAQVPLSITKQFRTLNDLVDELEDVFHVRVNAEVVATNEELVSLFSPTLLQLVPDATVLPAYVSPVISAEELMKGAMMGANNSLDNDDDDGDLDFDVARGAEVDDVISDARVSRDTGMAPSAKHDVLLADSEHVHESAELLEAMMNDQLDELMEPAIKQQVSRDIGRELREDLLAEDSVNYNVGASPGSVAAAAAAGPFSVGGASRAGAGVYPSASVRGGGVGDGGVDSLAWLHDIIPADSLMGATGHVAGTSESPLMSGFSAVDATATTVTGDGEVADPTTPTATVSSRAGTENPLLESLRASIGLTLDGDGDDTIEGIEATAAKRGRGAQRGAAGGKKSSATAPNRKPSRGARTSNSERRSGSVTSLADLLTSVNKSSSSSASSRGARKSAAAASKAQKAKKPPAHKPKASPKAKKSQTSKKPNKRR